MMVLRWRAVDPALRLQWRGPDGVMATAVQAMPDHPIPTLIGPPGPAGPQGPQGPLPEMIDGGTFN